MIELAIVLVEGDDQNDSLVIPMRAVDDRIDDARQIALGVGRQPVGVRREEGRGDDPGDIGQLAVPGVILEVGQVVAGARRRVVAGGGRVGGGGVAE